jgi:peptidoglycan hydrolase-like protein with peptidoglycan-binding domain
MKLTAPVSRLNWLLMLLMAMLGLVVPAQARESEVRAGTVFKLTMETYLTSKTAQIGDKFTATITEDVRATSGEVVIPRNSKVEGQVSAVTAAQRGSKSGTLGIDFVSLKLANGRTVNIDGQLTSLDAKEKEQIDEENRVSGGSSAKRNVVFIGGGAAGGAAIGAIAGGGKGAGIGAVLGAVGGVLGSVVSKGVEAEVQVGQRFGMELLRPIYLNDASDRAANDRNDRNDSRGRNNDQFDDRDRPEPPRGRGNTRPGLNRPIADLTSQSMTRRTQNALRELNYFRGSANGVSSPSLRVALRSFQRDNNLEQTGNLDVDTAFQLGLINEDGVEVLPVRIITANALKSRDGIVRIDGETEANGADWDVYADSRIDKDTLRVYVKGLPPAELGNRAITRYPIKLDVNDTSAVKKVIFYGEGAPITVDLSNPGGETVKQLRQQTQALVDTYKETTGLGRRGTATLNAARITQSQAQILAAIGNLNNTVALLEQLSLAAAAEEGLRGAVISVVREARQTQRLIERLNENRVERQLADIDRNVKRLSEIYEINVDRD